MFNSLSKHSLSAYNARRMTMPLPSNSNAELPPPPEKADLSEREIEILRLLATGVSNKEIAQKLFISPNTVKVHLRNIFAKTGAVSRTEATLFAIRAGLVVVDTPLASTPSVASKAAPLSDAPPATVPVTPVRRAWLSPRWAVVGVLGLLLIVSPLLWRALTAVSATPTVLANTPAPSPAPQRWQASANMPAAQSAFAVATYNNQIYAIAGNVGEVITNVVNRYDASVNQWITLNPKPLAVAEVSAAVVGGQIYIPGGRLTSGTVTNTMEVYNPSADAWEQRAPLPLALSAYALAAFEGRLYLFGGWDGKAYRTDIFVYDPGQDAWAKLPPMPTARGQAGVAVAGNQIYVIGGVDATQPLTLTEAFDPNTQTWLARAPLPVGRANMGMTTIADTIYLVGGEGEPGPALTLQYSPAQDEWKTFEAPTDVSQWHGLGLAVLNGQSLLAFGGEQNGERTKVVLSYQVIYTLAFPIIK